MTAIGRRRALRMALGAPVLAVAGCAEVVPQGVGLALTPSRLTDPAVLNFALNLEYLEAEYYLRGVTGRGLDAAEIGPDPGPVTGGRAVRFATPALGEFAAELARNERDHVRFIRQTIQGSPLIEPSRPAIDFTGAFRAAGEAAGIPGFDPFADEASFLLGAMLFEDVGVTAYHGAADLLASKQIISAAAGILAVEGYHGGMVRAQLFLLGSRVRQAANAIAVARDRLNVPPSSDDPGIIYNGGANIIPSDQDAKAFSRTPQQVLNIVYLTPRKGVKAGGFFPKGVNGVVQST